MEIGGHKFNALVDTGASKSCLSERVRSHLHRVLTPLTAGHLLRMGNGDLVQPLGYCTLPIRIGQSHHTVIFTVLTSCIADVILGWDFLSSADAFINCASRELHLTDSDYAHPPLNSTLAVLQLEEDLVLPPKTAVAAVLIPSKTLETSFGLIEPLPTTFVQKGVVIPYSLASVTKGKLHVWITNASSQPQILPRHSRIANFNVHTEDNFTALSNTRLSPAPTISTDFSQQIASMIDSNLATQEQRTLAQLLTQYCHTFDFGTDTLPRTPIVQHHIDTGDSPPVRSRPYRVAAAERRIIQQQIDDMLKKNVIEPSSSPWSSLVVLVKKERRLLALLCRLSQTQQSHPKRCLSATQN